MKQLNINELHKDIHDKQIKRNKFFDFVLDKCHLKIKRAAKSEFYECYYDVPEFIVGLPIYKITDCILYLYDNLIENGFKVKYQYPKILHISWKLNDSSSKQLLIEKQDNIDSLLFNRTHASNNKPNLTFKNINNQVTQKNNGKFVLSLD